VELKSAVEGVPGDDPLFEPWRARLAELEEEPDEIDHLLAQVEASFEEPEDEPARPIEISAQMDFIMKVLGTGDRRDVHRVRTVEGSVFEGTWDEIVARMRDAASVPEEPVASFMHRAARQIRERTGEVLPCDTPEAFLRAGARLGLLRIEA
jgi:hypothetical protein